MTSIKLDLFAVQSNKLLLKSTFQKNLASIRLTEMHQTIVFWHKIQSEMKIIVYVTLLNVTLRFIKKLADSLSESNKWLKPSNDLSSSLSAGATSMGAKTGRRSISNHLGWTTQYRGMMRTCLLLSVFGTIELGQTSMNVNWTSMTIIHFKSAMNGSTTNPFFTAQLSLRCGPKRNIHILFAVCLSCVSLCDKPDWHLTFYVINNLSSTWLATTNGSKHLWILFTWSACWLELS